MKSKVVGVIPARFQSSRFPGKPLAKIHGKEMILWVIEGAQKSKLLDKIMVATDDERIFSLVQKSGAEAVMTDPSLPSGTDRIYSASKNLNFDIVINIQGDEPLIGGRAIDALISPMLADASLSMSTLAHKISHEELYSENSVKVIINDNFEAIYFSRFPVPYSKGKPGMDQQIDACLKHMGLYAYRKEFLHRFCQHPQSSLELAESLEQLRALSMGAKIKVIPVEEKSWGVDTPEDLLKIENILKGSK